ncbi:uncharacterized protein NECHADRAFT_78715 [Fusarium vanettenii 77-13-4]|uniref:Uncharacterized protein n=1 Tax=Fusarium vanettenii (strain ATCC MYA-4622 / CBS 123669 / FGSC 9596 / NRRL 45880 / 77-13-4) TaxID=660122 RepID=C7YPD2_FUSV7|nr:uncharacterized protein NECHADRAFT_78715 [Fusarium vanettenii 77-13-4]EEU45824.1 predicted protein [Fusarium vanettenii 77-13-4]
MPNPFHATYNFVAWTLDQGQVPSDVRRSLELVRTCDKDLQHLIELRNECLPRLERRPLVLARVHSIIEAAQAGLEEACAIVERCRPEAHSGKTPFASRVAWLLVDSGEFRNLEPIVSRHHDAVLAELNFLRNIAMLAPVPEVSKEEGRCVVQKEAPVFDNIALLGDILGDISVEAKPLPPIPSSLTPAPVSPPPVPINQHQGYPTEPSSSHMPSPHMVGLSPDSSAPEILPMGMNHSTTSRPQQIPGPGFISEDMTGLANLLRDTLVSPDITSPQYPYTALPNRPVTTSSNPMDRPTRPGAITPVQTGSNHRPSFYNTNDGISDMGPDRSQRASIGYTPSVSSFASQSSPPPLNNRASSSTLPVYTYGMTQHQNTSSTTLPARFTWANSSSVTVSSLPQTFTRSTMFMDGTGWGQQPIAELDSSPYQMVPVVRLASDAGYPGSDSKNPVVQFVKQLNTIPIELSAATDLFPKTSLQRQSALSEGRHGRTVNQPEGLPSEQFKEQPMEQPRGFDREATNVSQPIRTNNSFPIERP